MNTRKPHETDKTFIERVVAMENAAPVDELLFDGVKIWPLVRWMIVDRSRDLLFNRRQDGRKFMSSTEVLRRGLENLPALLSLLFVRRASRRWSELNNGEVWCCAIGQQHLRNVDGSQFNVFSDSLAELMDEEYEVSGVELFPSSSFRSNSRTRTPVSIAGLVAKAWLRAKGRASRSRLNGREHIAFLKGFDSMLRVPDEESIQLRASFMLELSEAFQKKLVRHQPAVVIVICFYSEIGMALALACHREGIPCVELQHGKQGPYHYMYSHWANLPREGYALIPSHFWTWGEASRAVIAQWTDTCDGHDVFVGGNPWLAYKQQAGLETSLLDPGLQKKIKDARYAVLVSLQPHEGYFTEALLEAMPRAPECLWLIRPHPSMRMDIPAIYEKLKELGVQQFEVEAVMDADLYALLSAVDMNITYWSSVAFEALAFGVHSIIAHPNGKEVLHDYIQRRHFAYAESGEEILRLVSNPDFAPEPEEQAFIVASAQLVRKTLTHMHETP